MRRIYYLLQKSLIPSFLILASTPANAQITPDNTLGKESSQFNQNVLINGLNADKIDGGATRGSNLFHSFSQFNINDGQRVYFANPSGVLNILSRVTGGNASNILGTLGVDGAANLFLMNPNGILFGQNASLDVRGSFVGTTANAIGFGLKGVFSATNPEVPPLLTINPSALLFNQINRSGIINRSRQIATPGSFYLIGGDITFDGGVAASLLNRLELGAVVATGIVELIGSGNQMQLVFPEGLSQADIVLQNNGFALTSGGGAISLNARNLSLFGNSFISSVLQTGEGNLGVAAGDVVVNATGDVTLDNLSNISSRGLENSLGDTGNVAINAQSIRLTNRSLIDNNGTRSRGNITLNANDNVSLDNSIISTIGIFNPVGKSGDITIATRNINLSNQSIISSGNTGQGQGGKITLKAQEAISLTSGSNILSSSTASAFGQVNNQPSGNIEIKTRNLILDGGGTISSSNLDEGRGGDVGIIADDSIFLNDFGSISSSSVGQGDGGNIEFQTRSLTLANGGNIGTQSLGRGSTGDAGDLTITTQNLLVREGAQVGTGTSGTGKGGNLTVNASGNVEVIGVSANSLFNSRLSTSANQGLTGNAGDLTINAQNILVRDGGVVDAITSGQGRGGNLTVNATGKVELIGTSVDGNIPSVFSTSAQSGSTGDAGDLTITTQDLFVRDGGQISASTFNIGKAGNLTVNASRKVELIGASADGRIISGLGASVQQGSAGDAGSLTIKTQDLLVQDGARVFTGTLGVGKAGNLTVNASNKVELIGTSVNGSPGGLFASAERDSTGDAGNLKVDTHNLLVRDGAQVLAGTFNSGRGGNLTVNASESVQLIGKSTNNEFPSGLFTSSERGSTGDAGDLKLNTPNLVVRNGAGVFVYSVETGNAGTMTINADRISLDNKASLNANTRSSNKDPKREQATINLNSPLIILRRGSNISTNATGENVVGGNININSDIIAAFENSDFRANSTDFRGGRVKITTQGIFGTQPRNAPTPESDITATGASPDLSGTTEINTPDVDPTQGLIELPREVVDASNQLSQLCPRGELAFRRPLNKFIVTGRGSLPPSPLKPLPGKLGLRQLAFLDDEETGRQGRQGDGRGLENSQVATTAIIEAQGIIKAADGTIMLVAEAPNATPYSRPVTSVCPASMF
jgi:filamentous hemagglutinin family protein